jgi:excisionase family DNA binding protein
VEAGRAIAAVIAGDEMGLRRLAELLAPYLPGAEPPPVPDRWLTTREAADYAGTSPNVLHKAMAARAIHFEQDVPGGKAWFRREDVDAWRRRERIDRRRRAA